MEYRERKCNMSPKGNTEFMGADSIQIANIY